MEKIIITTLLLFGFLIGKSQNDATFHTNGLLKGTATIAPGFMLNQHKTNIYVNGDLEYFPEERVSIRGDVYWYVGSQQKPNLFKENSSMYWGALYHFRMNRADFFVGFQPGLSLTQPDLYIKSNAISDNYKKYDMQVCPQLSAVAGATYYVGKYFNFFLNTRYIRSSYRSNTSIGLDEMRISAGLGFNVGLKKK